MVHSRYFELSRSNFKPLEQLERALTLQICEEAYKSVRWTLPPDFMQYSAFLRVVRDLEFTSSPGYPYCRQSSTIGEWLGWDGIWFDENRLQELWYQVQEFLSGHFESYYRVFVKSEPHTRAKAALGRWRLIICPPLCEQVVWAMVFSYGNDVEVRRVRDSPSMQGMKLCGGEWKQHQHLFRQRGYDCALDKSAWDWTCHRELLSIELDLRERLLTAESEIRTGWRRLADWLYEKAFDHPRLVLSDGRVYEQVVPGIMKSGCINTISTNSHCQVIVHVLACLRSGLRVNPLPVAVGDDTLGCYANTPDAQTFLELGVVLKDLTDVQFVGHRWLPDGPVPAYNAKHLFRYLSVKPEHLDSFLDSMVHLYAHSPSFQRVWRGLAGLYGYPMPSEAYVLFWYDCSDDLSYF